MKRYVVNLDRSKGRRAWFEGQAASLGLDFIHIRAIDGHNISEAELLAYHQTCPPERSVSFGELGCFLSHLQIWRRVAADRDDWAFIAEDDVHFSLNAGRFLTSADWLPPGIEIVKAETMLTRVQMSANILSEAFGHRIRLLQSFHRGSAAYFLSRTGAERLVESAASRCEPVDHLIFEPPARRVHGLRIAQIEPAIAIQDDQFPGGVGLRSELDDERLLFLTRHPQSRKRRGARRYPREVQRIFRQVAAPFRELFLTLAGRSVFRTVPVTLKNGLTVSRRTKPSNRP